MKNFLLFAVLVSLPLLLGGCGGKVEVEPVAEVKPQSESLDKKEFEGVNYDELEMRGNIFDKIAYHKGSPYTGKAINYYENGQKRRERNYKDGKEDGLCTEWYQNGQKFVEENYKDGKLDGLMIGYNKDGTGGYRRTYKDGELVED